MDRANLNGRPQTVTTPSRDELIERFAGDEALMEEIVAVFIEEHSSMALAIGRARASLDGAEIARAAHTIKGAIGYFGDGPAAELARDLEQSARDGCDPALLRADLESLERELSRLADRLRALLAETGATA